MEHIRLGKSVRRVTLLKPDTSGHLQPTMVYQVKDKKKKQTRFLRPAERARRRAIRAQRVFWDSVASRHDDSNMKRRDGWIRNALTDVARAYQKSADELTKGT